jgi:hypothetical protein
MGRLIDRGGYGSRRSKIHKQVGVGSGAAGNGASVCSGNPREDEGGLLDITWIVRVRLFGRNDVNAAPRICVRLSFHSPRVTGATTILSISSTEMFSEAPETVTVRLYQRQSKHSKGSPQKGLKSIWVAV